jgi:hypothetical protein
MRPVERALRPAIAPILAAIASACGQVPAASTSAPPATPAAVPTASDAAAQAELADVEISFDGVSIALRADGRILDAKGEPLGWLAPGDEVHDTQGHLVARVVDTTVLFAGRFGPYERVALTREPALIGLRAGRRPEFVRVLADGKIMGTMPALRSLAIRGASTPAQRRAALLVAAAAAVMRSDR